jgi:hypothetical protein
MQDSTMGRISDCDLWSLLKIYRLHPCLWETKSKEYSDKKYQRLPVLNLGQSIKKDFLALIKIRWARKSTASCEINAGFGSSYCKHIYRSLRIHICLHQRLVSVCACSAETDARYHEAAS